MADFLASLSVPASRTVFENVGQPVTYYGKSGVVQCQAVIEDELREVGDGFEAPAMARVMVARMLIEDVGESNRGDKIVYLSNTYIVEDLLGDDGIEIEVSIRNE